MDRRLFALALSATAAGTFLGCDTEQKPSHTATLLSNGEVQDAMKAVDAAIGDLEDDVGRFDDDSWREVVPDVQAAANDVRDAFDRLRTALGVAES